MTQSSLFWNNKRVLITGHTGFKGSWLSIWLKKLGCNVTGISLAPNNSPNLFELAEIQSGMTSHFCDIRDLSTFTKIIKATQPEIVFHLAAQPLVRASYRDPIGTFSTNVMGTANLLNALRDVKNLKVIVMVTTDKVYRNFEQFTPYKESDELGGHDPYSASKAASEIIISSYRTSFLQLQGIAVATARAGNVIGGGDWSEDRLIPDAVRSWTTNTSLVIRRPEAVRPWQHVLEPLNGYMKLAQMLWVQPNLAGAYNFGPNADAAASVRIVIEHALRVFGRGEVFFDAAIDGPHEAGLLTLDTTKSKELLDFKSKWFLLESIHRTMEWYQSQYEGQNARILCESEIDAYEAIK